MARRKWNGSGEMREVNEMYLRLNTLRDRFGIGPLIKNHSEGEVMRRDRFRSKDSFSTLPYSRSGSREPSEIIQELLQEFKGFFFLAIIRHENATDLQLNARYKKCLPPWRKRLISSNVYEKDGKMLTMRSQQK